MTASSGSGSSSNGMWGGASSSPPAFSLPPSAAAAEAAGEATAAAGPCLTYWIGQTLYVAVTNRCNVRACVRSISVCVPYVCRGVVWVGSGGLVCLIGLVGHIHTNAGHAPRPE